MICSGASRPGGARGRNAAVICSAVAPRALPLAVLLALLCTGRSAGADTADSIGLGPEDLALGGSVAARPGTFAATYFNPAALSPGGDPPGFAELSMAFTYAHPVLYAERLDGTELPLGAEPADTIGLTLGARFDLGHGLGLEGLSVGLGCYVPTSGFFSWSIHPDEQPQWLFLTDRTNRIGLHLGLGYRLVSWLSVGVGLRVLFDVETLTTGRVIAISSTTDPDTGETIPEVRTQLGEEVAVYGRAAPNVGLLLTPSRWLRLGLTYRGKLFVDDWGWTRIQGAPTGGDLGYVHRFAHYFHPHQAVFAAAGRIYDDLWLSVDLTYSRWEEGLTASHQQLGPGRFGNTLTPAVGIEWRPAERWRLLGGYRYERSPFDNLGGPTNLLANDQHITSAGLEVDLGRLGGVRLAASTAGRVSWLVEREEHKDPRRFVSDRQLLTNPGLSGYRHGGAVPGFSLGLEVQW